MMRKINPTVKAIAIMITAILIAFSFSIIWTLILIGYCLIGMLLSRINLKRFLIILLPASLAAISLTVAIYLSSSGNDVGTVGFSMQALSEMNAATKAISVGVRIYGYFFLGASFALTTNNNDFIYSLMQQLKCKPKYAYGILAAFNLIPTIKIEIKKIKLAYKVRGYSLSPFSIKPLFSALVNALHWSESLAMAMESKGFDEEGERTYSRILTIKATDFLWAVPLVAIGICSTIFS